MIRGRTWGAVVGGLYCALFGLIAAVGVQQLAKADLTSDRNLFISGFSLFMGLSVPAYFAARASAGAPAAGQTLARSGLGGHESHERDPETGFLRSRSQR